MEQWDSPEHPGTVRTQEEAHSTLELEFFGAHPGGANDSEIIVNPQPDEACRVGDKTVRAGSLQDFSGMVPNMAPPRAPLKLAHDNYDGNTDLNEYLIYSEEMAM